MRTLPASSQVIHYVYGEGGMLLAEHDGATGAILKEYVWLDDMPLVQVTGPIATPSYAYVHTGQIGEPLMVTDASQARLWDVAVDPWGNALTLSASAIDQPLRLPGQWRQAESGLFQNWHRDYDPTLGRYIESDPIGLEGGSNLFAYVEGNPTKYTDPTGEVIFVPIVIGALIGFDLSFGYQVWIEDRTLDCIDWTDVGVSTALGAVGGQAVRWFRYGREFKVGKDFRGAPFGNRNPDWTKPPHDTGRLPHYHKPGPKRPDGSRAPGHSPKRHRPWDKSPKDKSWRDRWWPR